MTTLLNVTPSSSAALQVTNWAQYKGIPIGDGIPASIAAQFVATWNTTAGGTFDAWLQTSIDGGVTAIDIAQFHVTTASSALAAPTRKAVNLSSLTPITTEVTPSDGTLGSSATQDGLIGSQFRVKYTVTGAYDGVTSFRLDVNRRLVTLQSTTSSI